MTRPCRRDDSLDVSTVEQSALAGAAFDFDGDGLSDRAVFRPEFGGWYVEGQATQFLGLAGDVPVPADYDGNRATNTAVFRDGAWYIGGQPTVFVGQTGDVPVPGDYDGDGTTDAAVYRDGAWYIDGQATRYFGTASDVPCRAITTVTARRTLRCSGLRWVAGMSTG